MASGIAFIGFIIFITIWCLIPPKYDPAIVAKEKRMREEGLI